MPILETGKKLFEKATGWRRPGKGEVKDLVIDTKPLTLKFEDDGVIPNHPHWPLILYRGAVRLPSHLDPAAVLEDLFAMNKWNSSWRNGIYDFVHYHSKIHEVVGIAAGKAKVQFGGNRGKSITLKAGDVAILPAGTGHRCLSSSKDFLVVGAYPSSGKYESLHEQRGSCACCPNDKQNSKTAH